MNFDFLKNLTALNQVFDNCDEAECFASTRPSDSMSASCESAEALLRLLSLAAYNEHLKAMSFDDILNDSVVCDFIDDQKLIDSFKAVKSSMNLENNEEKKMSRKEAVNTLTNLHYIAVRAACKLNLIKDEFPTADGQIYDSMLYRVSEFNSERMDSRYYRKSDFDFDIEHAVQKMFIEYLEKQKNDYQNEAEKVKNLKDKLEYNAQSFCLNETFEVKDSSLSNKTIALIKSYFGTMGMKALKKEQGVSMSLTDQKIDFSGKLTIDDYTTSTLEEFVKGILYDIQPGVDFKISTKYDGPTWNVNGQGEFKGFIDMIPKINKSEKFVYKFYDSIEIGDLGRVGKYENGKWLNLRDEFSDAILDKEYDSEWNSFLLHLDIDFDFKKHFDILEALHECVRKHVPEDQIEDCELFWNEAADYDYEKGSGAECMVYAVQWPTKKLRVVQDFLDEINEIIKPIMDECEGYDWRGERDFYNWVLCDEPFGIAEWHWTDEGFKITGVEL